MGAYDEMLASLRGDEPDDPLDDDGGEGITCNLCGTSELHWEDFGSGWKLYDDKDDRHSCGAVPNANDFDAL